MTASSHCETGREPGGHSQDPALERAGPAESWLGRRASWRDCLSNAARASTQERQGRWGSTAGWAERIKGPEERRRRAPLHTEIDHSTVCFLLMWTVYSVFIELVTVLLLFLFFFFAARPVGLIAQPGNEPAAPPHLPPLDRGQSPSHWTTRKVPETGHLEKLQCLIP